jgi:hypothetical protein
VAQPRGGRKAEAWYCAFLDKFGALEFEKYLKSDSGRAFAKKRLCVVGLATDENSGL